MKYSVKAASVATGVSESRLRTWERRYGIPHPGRSENGRRLYDEDDLAVIRRMAVLVGSGVPASQAAAAALSGEEAEPRSEAPAEHAMVPALVESSLAYDEAAIVEQVRAAVDSLGWGAATEEVVFPALERLGYYWGIDSIPSANEHFVTEIVRREVFRATSELPVGQSDASIVLACPEDERHDVGLAVLSLLLRRRAIRVYYLGGDVPAADLLAAVKDTGADAVCMSATLPSSLGSMSRATRRMISARALAHIFVGGPALDSEGEVQVAGIRLPRSLDQAADFIATTLGDLRKETQ